MFIVDFYFYIKMSDSRMKWNKQNWHHALCCIGELVGIVHTILINIFILVLLFTEAPASLSSSLAPPNTEIVEYNVSHRD